MQVMCQRQLILGTLMGIRCKILILMMVGLPSLRPSVSISLPREEDTRNLHLHAKHNAQEAVTLARQRVQQFDTDRALERQTNEAIQSAKARDQEPEKPPSSSDLTFAGAGVDRAWKTTTM
jgi:biopolymer transport protein ExbD